MNIFISWSGQRSRQIASALNEWLPDIFQDLTTWMSTDDVEAGVRWGTELNQQLQSTNFGILCLTPENLNARWLLFEAGSLAKAISISRVVPYCYQLVPTDVPYPLAQFQAVSADREGTNKILQSINAIRDERMPDDRLCRHIDKWWPDLESTLKALTTPIYDEPKQRSDRALLEEVLQLIRQQSRFDATSALHAAASSKVDLWWLTGIDTVPLDEIAKMETHELARYLAELVRLWDVTSDTEKLPTLEHRIRLTKKELFARTPAMWLSQPSARNSAPKKDTTNESNVTSD
jgi:hypothetical protein